MKDFLGITWRRIKTPQFYWFCYAWFAGCSVGWHRDYRSILFTSTLFIGGFLIGCLSRYLRTKTEDELQIARLLYESENAN